MPLRVLLASALLASAARGQDGGWTLWPQASEPPPGLSLEPSRDLGGFSFASGPAGMAIPPQIGADTWYPSWGADGRLYSSWTDGKVGSVVSNSGYDGRSVATTGFAVIDGDSPFNLSLSDVAVFGEPGAPYQGRYPSLNFHKDGVRILASPAAARSRRCRRGASLSRHASLSR